MSSPKEKKKSERSNRGGGARLSSKEKVKRSKSPTKRTDQDSLGTKKFFQVIKSLKTWCTNYAIPFFKYIWGYWIYGLLNPHHHALQIPPFHKLVPSISFFITLGGWIGCSFWASSAKYNSYKASHFFSEVSKNIYIYKSCTTSALTSNGTPRDEIVGLEGCEVAMPSQTYSNNYISFSTQGPARITYYRDSFVFHEYIYTNEMTVGGLAPNPTLMKLVFDTAEYFTSAPLTLDGKTGLELAELKWTGSQLTGRTSTSLPDRRVYFETTESTTNSSSLSFTAYDTISVESLSTKMGSLTLLGELSTSDGLTLRPKNFPGERKQEFDFESNYSNSVNNQNIPDGDLVVFGSFFGASMGVGGVDRILDRIEQQVRIADDSNQKTGEEISSLVFIFVVQFLMCSSLWALFSLVYFSSSKVAFRIDKEQLKRIHFSKYSSTSTNSPSSQKINSPLLETSTSIQGMEFKPTVMRLTDIKEVIMAVAANISLMDGGMKPKIDGNLIEDIFNIPTSESLIWQNKMLLANKKSGTLTTNEISLKHEPMWNISYKFSSVRTVCRFGCSLGGILTWLLITSFVEWRYASTKSTAVFLTLIISAAVCFIIGVAVCFVAIFAIPIFGRKSLKSDIALKWQPSTYTSEQGTEFIKGVWIVDGPKTARGLAGKQQKAGASSNVKKDSLSKASTSQSTSRSKNYSSVASSSRSLRSKMSKEGSTNFDSSSESELSTCSSDSSSSSEPKTQTKSSRSYRKLNRN